MNIEEKFNQNVQFVLNELKTEALVSGENSIRYVFIEEENAPSKREQERILRWIMKLGAIEHLKDIQQEVSFLFRHPLISPPTIGYKLSIDGAVFSALSKIYDGDLSKQSPDAILTKARKLGKAKKVDTSKPSKPKTNKVPFFSQETREVIFSDKSCEIPVGNQFELAKALFGVPVGTWVKETDVVNQFTRGDNKQSFYDAQRHLNSRIEKYLGIKNLLEYQTAMVRISPETISKLNHSEQ